MSDFKISRYLAVSSIAMFFADIQVWLFDIGTPLYFWKELVQLDTDVEIDTYLVDAFWHFLNGGNWRESEKPRMDEVR